jgi:predicted DNA-binding protein
MARRKKIEEDIVLRPVMFRLNESAKTQLDVLAAETGRSKQELLTEAVNYIFKKNHKDQIA